MEEGRHPCVREARILARIVNISYMCASVALHTTRSTYRRSARGG